MKIKTDEIASVIKQEIQQFATELEISDVGRVIEIGDGIARIYGLANAMAGEMLEFQSSEGVVMGQVLNLELDTVGAVIYGDYLAVKEGDTVARRSRRCGKAGGADRHLGEKIAASYFHVLLVHVCPPLPNGGAPCSGGRIPARRDRPEKRRAVF